MVHVGYCVEEKLTALDASEGYGELNTTCENSPRSRVLLPTDRRAIQSDQECSFVTATWSFVLPK